MLTELVNTRTGQRQLLGRSLKRFAAEHGICKSELHKLVCRRKIAIRDWMLTSTADLLAQVAVAERAEEKAGAGGLIPLVKLMKQEGRLHTTAVLC